MKFGRTLPVAGGWEQPNDLLVYDIDGNLVETIGSTGAGPGQFEKPYGFDLDSAGNLVGGGHEQPAHRPMVVLLDIPTVTSTPTVTPTYPPTTPTIYPTPCLGGWASYPSIFGNMGDPSAVVAGKDGYIYVLNSWYSGQVNVFTSAGVSVRCFATHMNGPREMLEGPDGNLYIGDYGNDDIDVVSTAGVSVNSIGTGVLKSVLGMAFDGNGNLYVTDQKANQVLEFTMAGTEVRSFDRAHTGFGLGPAEPTLGRGGGPLGQRVRL